MTYNFFFDRVISVEKCMSFIIDVLRNFRRKLYTAKRYENKSIVSDI